MQNSPWICDPAPAPRGRKCLYLCEGNAEGANQHEQRGDYCGSGGHFVSYSSVLINMCIIVVIILDYDL